MNEVHKQILNEVGGPMRIEQNQAETNRRKEVSDQQTFW